MTLTRKHLAIASLLFAVLLGGSCANKANTAKPAATAPPPPMAAEAATMAVGGAPKCDDSLWQHVYTGDPTKFSKPQDRLKVITPCIAVTGTIFNSASEKDGDYHVRVTLDPQFKSLLNAKNNSGQSGHLVVEPVCAKTPTQPDTVKEGVCKGFSQNIFTPDMKSKRVRIVGVYVEDMEHGWREIHPVTSITVIP